jgi:hypothetical protein
VNEADANPQVTGSFSIRRFAQTTAGEVAAVGTLTMSLTDPATGAARTIVMQAAMPVEKSAGDAQVTPAASAQVCETLSLVLRPVELDVLGIAVQLDQVNVDFISRSTGRLGIVLCGAASVMDSSVTPADQMRILNTLLDAVG